MNLKYSIKQICTILNVSLPQGECKENATIKNIVIDSRLPQIGSSTLFIALKGNKQDGHQFVKEFGLTGGQFAVVSQLDESADVFQIVVDNPLAALQKIAEFHRAQFQYPVVGITGSNGKTIVKEWLYHMLKDNFSIVRSPKSYNSQIGVPLSVLEMSSEHNLAIFEAGISQVGEMTLLKKIIKPTIGVFTGIGDAHGAFFESKQQKLAEKMLLFESTSTTISANENATISYEIPFEDEASISNANLVNQVALHFSIPESRIVSKLKTLPIISMRLEQIQGVNNCILLNDAYTADFAALEIALRHLKAIANDKKKVLVLNLSEEQMRMTETDALSDLLNASALNEIVFIGKDNLLIKTRVEGKYFKSVDEFILNPPTFEDAIILFKGSRSNSLEKLVRHYAFKKHITQLEINLSSMRHNLNHFRSSVPTQVKTLAMVKAQSYGTGLVEIASFLQNEGLDYLGVAYADEGLDLRKAGISLPILVMNPEENAFDEIIDNDLEPSIYSQHVLQQFLHHLILRQVNNYPIHIKLDTGMNRLGFKSEDIGELISTLNTQPEVYVKSVFSHLSVSDDDREKQFTYHQVREFEIMTGYLQDSLSYKFQRHIANSSAVLVYPNTHFDMVRIGIGLYGLLEDFQGELENVLSFHSQVSQIKTLKEGESLGYGRSFIAKKETTIAIIPVGYADGLRRKLGNGNWEVIIERETFKTIGTVCMDMCMVDVSNSKVKVGDVVQLFGEGNSIFEMASTLMTIPYEVIAGISNRVHRVYLD